ncbi:MAG: hypothetical protein ACP5NS_01835 [Candidatus Pacearchaeota archaeon]
MFRERKKIRDFKEMLSRVGYQHTNIISPQREGRIQFRYDMYGGTFDINAFTGVFFEEMYCATFGGQKPANGVYKRVQPDIINGFGVGDIKASSIINDLHIKSEQLAGYLDAAREMERNSFYAFFFHTNRDGRNSLRDPRERLEGLVDQTLASLIIPGSLAVTFCTAALDEDNPWARSTATSRGSWVYLLCAGVRELFEKPSEFIPLLGGDMSHYSVERSIIEGLNINGHSVKPFPVLAIEDRGPSRDLIVPTELLRKPRDRDNPDLTADLFF